uniref:Uncharacterized protein n=1 Tax=Ciona intestinalis TaxID=7719 RepID=H2XLK0_CIOIN
MWLQLNRYKDTGSTNTTAVISRKVVPLAVSINTVSYFTLRHWMRMSWTNQICPPKVVSPKWKKIHLNIPGLYGFYYNFFRCF